MRLAPIRALEARTPRAPRALNGNSKRAGSGKLSLHFPQTRLSGTACRGRAASTSLGSRRRWTWKPNLGLVNGLLNGAFYGGGNRGGPRGEPRLKRGDVTRSCKACRGNAKSPPQKTLPFARGFSFFGNGPDASSVHAARRVRRIAVSS